MNQRSDSQDRNAGDETEQKDDYTTTNKNEANDGSDAQVEKPKMGHYRTQSQTITKETTERIKEYLQQRNAFSRAQDLNRTLSQSSNGTASNGRNGKGSLS